MFTIILPSKTVIYPFSYASNKGHAYYYENGAHVAIAKDKRVYIWPQENDTLCWIYSSISDYNEAPEQPNWVLRVNRKTLQGSYDVRRAYAPDFHYQIPRTLYQTNQRTKYCFDIPSRDETPTFVEISDKGMVFVWDNGFDAPCSVYPSAAYFNASRDTPMFIGTVDRETLKREGFGTRYFLDHELKYRKKYEGEYRDDAMHGHGTFYYTNGKIFEGIFNNNNRVSGTDTYPSGFTRSGSRAKNGKLEGKGRITMPNKTIIDGIFHQDRLNGEATITYANGDTLNGLFSRNKPVDYTLTRSTDKFHYVFRSRTEYCRQPSLCVSDHEGNKILTYSGGVNSDHQPEGKGCCSFSFPCGDILSCSWKNGAIDADEECVFIWVCDNVTEQTFTGKPATLVSIEPRFKHETLHAIFSGMMGVSMNVQTEDEDDQDEDDQDEDDQDEDDQDEDEQQDQGDEDQDQEPDFYQEEHRLDQILDTIRQQGLIETKQDLKEELKEANTVLLERTRLVESMQPRWNDAIQAMLLAHQNVAMISEQLESMDPEDEYKTTPIPRTFTCADDPRNVSENIKNSV